MHILKRYSAFEELYDTLKRNLPVSWYFLIISRLTATPNVVFSPPITPYPSSKGRSCTFSSSFLGWPSQTSPVLACKRFVTSRVGWERWRSGLGIKMIQLNLAGNFDSNPRHCVEDWTFFQPVKNLIPGISELPDKQIVLSFVEQGHYYLYIPAVWYYPEFE